MAVACLKLSKITMKNILTIDVEDYFHVAALAKSISADDWNNIACRIEKNTNLLLDLFDEHDAKATFFVLGWVAERYPNIIREIKVRGHEIASHGYSHQLIYKQTPAQFRTETIKSKQLLEDITGQAVLGYRAASYSITNKSLWALDILCETGFEYDSSIFPVRHDNYGIPGSPTEPYVLKTTSGQSLIEYPLSTYKFLGQVLPVAGGGYFRLYPYWLSHFFYKSINNSMKSFVFYLHPWEVDPEQPRIKASWFSEFRHYNNLDKCESRLRQLLTDFEFNGMDAQLKSLDLYTSSNIVSIEHLNAI